MVHNVLTKLTFNINKSNNIVEEVKELFDNDLQVYSYIVLNKEKEYSIVFYVCDNDKYNTISCKNCLNNVLNALNTENKNKVLTFEQSSLENIVTMFKPYISKLAKQYSNKWLKLEYEDAFQTGMLILAKLYSQGYYLNKFIIARTFQNEILMQLRKFKNEPIIVSLDASFNNDNNDDDLLYNDLVSDISDIEERERKENLCYTNDVFNDLKDIVIKKYGQRTFDKLYRDYSNGHTDTYSRHTMQSLKTYLEKMNINRHSFDKYL